jgi:diaminopimelate dehydrogenase
VEHCGAGLVECAHFEGEDLNEHKREVAHLASRFEVPAIVGAGWDPGAMSLFRYLFALLTPKGHTEISHRAGSNLHHTTVARAIWSVKDALCTEVRAMSGKRQRYVYIELEKGAKFEDEEAAIRSDPLFLEEETLVFPVDNVATLEDEGQGVLMERHGTAGHTPHQLLLLEARFSELALCAQCMLAAARALPTCKAGGYPPFDLPPDALWGSLRAQAEREWL